MAALGDVSREVRPPRTLNTMPLPGALGMGDLDFGREVPPKAGSGGTGPTIPTYGQIFPTGR